MKKVLALYCLVLASYSGFGQGQFIIGVKGGINGCFYTFNTDAIPASSISGGSYIRINSRGPAIPALFELIYGNKKFRVGYQFEYERILTTAYSYKTFNTAQSVIDTTVGDNTITQHYFCHNILLEYIIYDRKKIKVVPDITFGYFHGVSSADIAPYDFSALNQNRFKIGVAMNFEYWLGPLGVVATPQFSVEPIKAAEDPNSKGYMFFVGLNFGLRFNVTKSKQDNEANTDKKKKKQKEYVNPEEDN